MKWSFSLVNRVVFHQGSLSVIRVVFHQGSLLVIRVVFHQGSLLDIRVVFHQGSLSLWWSFIKLVSPQGDLSSG